MTLPPKHTLSKSTFLYGCQCPKRIWLHKFQPDVRDEETEAQASVFQSGTNVGLLARELFPYGIDASPETAYLYQQSVADTAKYISNGANVIYEAAFQFDGILAAIDILVKIGANWHAFEVKGTGSVKPPHIQDAAFQYYVITQLDLPLEDISIIHLNTEYVRQGELDIRQLFTCTSVLEQVKEQQHFISVKAAELKTVLQSTKAPEMEIGDHCFKPNNCNFYGFCSKNLSEEEEAEQGEAFINKKAIREFLGQLGYPLYFMDFETWMTAIPEQDGHWPFRPVPFQFSVHIQLEKGRELLHKYYLAEGPHDKHLEFAEKLIQCMGENGTVLVYNKTFENTILNHLKKDFDHLSEKIESIQVRMVDLMVPFRKNYRLPAMQGSCSIKYVLPALVPELSYDALAIGNGSDASVAFYNLKNESDAAKIAEVRNALLDYCGLDTLAMVRILDRLRNI